MFTSFETDPAAETGIMFTEFVTAVGMYVYMNESEFFVSVADVAEAFNTTPDLVREAVRQHPWLITREHEDPEKQLIESDGE